ncbi:MAG: Holliday junction DNA helicase RuvA [Ignavibacteria bacterium GWA2_55_11]|nr:MAG: Holliday junction DNA helicase RuvA [Ignavibacteria bacterium GWA2_55_11]OGU66798.1 MAG: Holliday junction DNA helicase RuvA [Ignavibacteria bacterium RIFCSPHIGHO2_02_FULL_56_12]OGU71417.1 MAG: Holliday junction DNA helicase RuvA [Ignavibacteria bacterium RIFCSPLOWO2_12_FULL_56_21]OGU71494.1 MAG: Holliday junction DNA helicase RuvA [Ignavibacteria bacterium RIFCSPLOWO2_02_FULL_55_14]HAV24096.1 Holliday junction branch migration protein RuvA [Bacteroidota bacterium]
MITSLTGTLVVKSPTEAVVDVRGVGYVLQIPLSTYAKLPDPPTSVTLLTHLQVRDDALVLFGFATNDERRMFRLLLSVNGIGPRLAQNILSGISAAELQSLIRTGNASALTSIPGIGRKTADRIIIELKDKLAKDAGSTESLSVDSQTPMEVRAETLQALLALGFQRSVAEKAVRGALQETQGKALGVEELLKRALRLAGSGR